MLRQKWVGSGAMPADVLSQVSQMSQDFHSILYFCALNYTAIEITRTLECAFHSS